MGEDNAQWQYDEGLPTSDTTLTENTVTGSLVRIGVGKGWAKKTGCLSQILPRS